MPKKGCDCPPPGAPIWMATFSDMMSLLLTFFILLVSFSSIQETKFQEAVGSLQGALGVLSQLPKVPVNMDLDTPPRRGDLEAGTLEEELKELDQQIEALKKTDEVKISRNEQGLAIRLDDEALFDPAKAILRPEAIGLLDLIAETLSGYPNPIRIEGHTDNLVIRTKQFPSNWELSAARAAAVLRHFQNHGLDPRRMSATGLGEWRPVASNDTAADRQKNRRVEIFMEAVDEEKSLRLGEHF